MRSELNGWTPARRAKQALAIRGWQPWKKSTGPTTVGGKARASRNASKPDSILHELGDLFGLVRSDLRQVRQMEKRAREGKSF